MSSVRINAKIKRKKGCLFVRNKGLGRNGEQRWKIIFLSGVINFRPDVRKESVGRPVT